MSKPNRLINEKSSYLLQHAYNPVDWYPWCDEAFEKAKKEDKPIFLSIGYSTCHWCHVMEKESFEDETVAKILNEYFVSIKVDREERPDIDSTYMFVCQAISGRGGWPLTIIMTPDKKPFFVSTYIPKLSNPVYGQVGLIDILSEVARLWKEEKEKIILGSNELVNELRKLILQKRQKGYITEDIFDITFDGFIRNFDEEFGGFGSSPKFPTPHNIMFLLRYFKKSKKDKALRMIEKTLDSILLGGIRDHIGGGFHRYSTDRKWVLPHFEKMLYDQATISISLIETYQVTRDKKYIEACEDTLSYVVRNLKNEEGGFFSAEDADSEGEEGKFYTWSYDEIKEILDENEFDIFNKYFYITPEGNYLDESRRVKTGKNVLFLKKFFEDQDKSHLKKIREKLFNYREKRVHPIKDDKILTNWNSLMIVAFSKAFSVTQREEYLEIAKKTTKFLLDNLLDSNGVLYHSYNKGDPKIKGYLEDYAFLIWALIELYENTFDEEYIEKSLDLADRMIELFWDDVEGGFFNTDSYNNDVIFRMKEIYDGATPSGNSVALLDLIKIYNFTKNQKYKDIIEKLISYASQEVNNFPYQYTFFLSAIYYVLYDSIQLIIVDNDKNSKELKEALAKISQMFIPNKTLIFRPSNQDNKLTKILNFLSEYRQINGSLTVYICTNYECKSPINSISELEKSLVNY